MQKTRTIRRSKIVAEAFKFDALGYRLITTKGDVKKLFEPLKEEIRGAGLIITEPDANDLQSEQERMRIESRFEFHGENDGRYVFGIVDGYKSDNMGSRSWDFIQVLCDQTERVRLLLGSALQRALERTEGVMRGTTPFQ